MKLSILGPPGSGKGTHTAKIARRYGLKHVVVGDIVKQEIRNKTELGKIMFEYTNVGKFVPSDIVMQVLASQIKDLDGFNGYIIDTAPINLEQKKAMDFIEIDGVISLKIDDFDELRNRILIRLICPKCRHVTSKNEATNEFCSKCGALLETRYDDKIETINIRLNQYLNETVPVIEQYRKQGKLIEINANQTRQQVFEEICEKLDKFFSKTL